MKQFILAYFKEKQTGRNDELFTKIMGQRKSLKRRRDS